MNWSIITLVLQIINKLLPGRTKSKSIQAPSQSYAKSVLSESTNFRAVADTLKGIVDNTAIDRALIVVYHNGGQPLDEATERKKSVLFEAHDEAVGSVINQYQNFVVDAAYHQMVTTLRTNKTVKFRIGDAPSLIVRYAGEQEGLQKVRLFELCESKGKDIYVFVSFWSKSEASLSFREKNLVLVGVTKLKPLVQNILQL